MTNGVGLDRLANRMRQEVAAMARSIDLSDENENRPVPTRVEFAHACGFTELDPWQERVLKSKSTKQILCCTRQAGKSTTTAIIGTHTAAYVPRSLVLILCPAQKQSSELARKCKDIHAASGLPLPALVGDSVTQLEMENGSRIIALPGSETSIRGYSAASMVIIDEASRVPEDVITGVLPSLATTAGPLLVLSTPAGKRGYFWESWSHADEWGWESTLITAKDVPRIKPEWLADQRRSMGEHRYLQEYECVFLDEETSVFSSDLIARALAGGFEPLWPLGSAAWNL